MGDDYITLVSVCAVLFAICFMVLGGLIASDKKKKGENASTGLYMLGGAVGGAIIGAIMGSLFYIIS
jgi:ABC-type Fe3+ transport system permease subunit